MSADRISEESSLAAPAGSAPEARAEFWRRVEEPLQRVRKFLYDLNARLTYFPREVHASYRIEGFAELKSLLQGEYRLDFPPAGRKHPLSLHFVCRGEEGKAREVVSSRAAVTHHVEYLQRHGIPFTVSEKYHRSGAAGPNGEVHLAIHVAPVVPVSLTFDVDVERGGLRLHVWNLERLGRASYPLPPERVDADLLAEVEKAVLREPNRLNELTGFHVPEEVRGQLQRLLYVDARRKAIELAGDRARSRAKGGLAQLFRREDRGPEDS